MRAFYSRGICLHPSLRLAPSAYSNLTWLERNTISVMNLIILGFLSVVREFSFWLLFVDWWIHVIFLWVILLREQGCALFNISYFLWLGYIYRLLFNLLAASHFQRTESHSVSHFKAFWPTFQDTQSNVFYDFVNTEPTKRKSRLSHQRKTKICL